jgi:hypothetical protein
VNRSRFVKVHNGILDLKVMGSKLTTLVYANSKILLARALRDSLARYRDPHLQRPTINPQKFVCQNLITGQNY